MARLRVVLLASIAALSVCAHAPVSPALGARLATARLHGAHSHRAAHARRAPRCARASSFHARGGPTRHARHRRHALHRAHCLKRRSRGHRTAGRRGRGGYSRGQRGKSHGRGGHSHRRPGHSRGRDHHTRAAANSSCPDVDLSPNEEDIDRVRAATLCLVNRERTDHGERPLAANERLEQSAQAHSQDMAFGDYFEHVGARGDTPSSRMRAAGYVYSSRVGYEVGENIAWGTLWLATPRAIVAAWMGSPGHRANILGAHFRDTGVGVSPHPPASLANGQAGAIYTQDFGVIIAA